MVWSDGSSFGLCLGDAVHYYKDHGFGQLGIFKKGACARLTCTGIRLEGACLRVIDTGVKLEYTGLRFILGDFPGTMGNICLHVL